METYSQMNPEFEGYSFSGGGRWDLKGKIALTKENQPRWRTFKNLLTVSDAFYKIGDYFALSKINIKWPQLGKGNAKAVLDIENVQFKNLKGGFQIRPWQWWYDLEKFQFGFSFLNLPTIGDLKPIKFDNFSFNFYNFENFDFAGTLTTAIKDLRPYLEKMCVGKQPSLPNVALKISYPEISGNQKKFVMRGQTEFDVFSGKGILKDFKVFDWTTSVPETQFNFNTENMQLAEIGQFLNFGKMEGKLGAYAEDVVMQSMLPTKFRSKIALLPLEDGGEVIFSSKAMQNFTQLFTPQDFTQQIPGILRWFTFGWPSDAIGGFNIKYAGISLYSKDGSVLLETLDPPEVVSKEGGHFLLYGYRFKIPINYWSYPVVLDHQGMSQFISHMYSYLLNLKAQQTEQSTQTGESNETEKWCKYNLDDVGAK